MTTTTGANHARYAEHMAATDPRPSRFSDSLAYREWCERADIWAAPTTEAATEIVYSGLACQDCAIAHANDDYSALADDRAEHVQQALASAASDGLACVDTELARDFSSVPCGVCGTSLAGARFGIAWEVRA